MKPSDLWQPEAPLCWESRRRGAGRARRAPQGCQFPSTSLSFLLRPTAEPGE